jgi:DNA repair protein RecN (Recombination protein N)
MLIELRVENLLLIERAELALDAGLNVITGETGAGKTVLAHALDLLLGGKPRRGILRPGADEAYIEGVFVPPSPLMRDPDLAELGERLALEADELVLARRVTAEGRTRAYIQGRSASALDLRLVGSRLLAFYGQHEHRRLTLTSAQLDVLDAFCGQAHLDARARFEQLWSKARCLQQELEDLRQRAGGRERDLDLLEFELREIEQATPSGGEEAELEAERARLAGVESLREAAVGATGALEPGGDVPGGEGALGLLARAASELARAPGVDSSLDRLARRLEAVSLEAEDLARELRGYEESLQVDPARLEQVDERLALFSRLKRKHGGTITAVLEHAEHCRREHSRLSSATETSTRLERELGQLLADLDAMAASLRESRKKVAGALEQSVCAELALLAMGDASFEVVLDDREQAPDRALLGRLGPTGADAVEFLIAPNPGVPAGRLREIASGGELSRVMLALMSVTTAVEGAPTVVFDEIDAGVGGNTAHAVAQKLRALAERRQVICVTHLPHVASLAARHFRVVKGSGPGGGVARAEVERLDRGELVAELCRMLGADAGDRDARRHVERLLAAA